jgi:L-asparaginase II
MPSAVPLVRVVRSGLVESVHYGHVAVCDADGRLLASVGDPGRVVFSRSSMKPLQASVSLRRIANALPDDLVAIACASHNGEPEHVRTVRRLLRAGGIREGALACPPAYPSRRSDAARVPRPRRIFHNCSGKHAGMLAGARAEGWKLDTYLEPSHPLQREITRAIRRATGVEDPPIGVDGCGLPVHGVPLRAMAMLYARLARPDRLGPWRATVQRAVAAMRAHPFLVAGTGRLDTALMPVVPEVLSKGGAEALACAAILTDGIGVAVKIDDGGDRAAGPALVRVLALLGAVDDESEAALAATARPDVLGGGRPVGALEAAFRLRRARP